MSDNIVKKLFNKLKDRVKEDEDWLVDMNRLPGQSDEQAERLVELVKGGSSMVGSIGNLAKQFPKRLPVLKQATDDVFEIDPRKHLSVLQAQKVRPDPQTNLIRREIEAGKSAILDELPPPKPSTTSQQVGKYEEGLPVSEEFGLQERVRQLLNRKK